MAIPPEPLDQVLPDAKWVVEAVVKEIVSSGPPQPRPPGEGLSTVPAKVASQVVRLTIKRVLRGNKDTRELIVVKPVGAYALRVGNKGPFLLDGSEQPVILGRYGPDTYPLAKLEAALEQ